MSKATPVLLKKITKGHTRYTINLRVTFFKSTHYLPVYKYDSRFDCSPNQWDEQKNQLKSNKQLNPDYIYLNQLIVLRNTELQKLIDQSINNNQANMLAIRKQFYNDFPSNCFFSFLDEVIKNSKASAKSNFKNLSSNLKRYFGTKKPLINEFDYRLIKNYIKYLEDKGYQSTSIGIYLRYIRWLLNKGIKEEIYNKSIYPFSKIYGQVNTINIAKYEKKERKLAINKELINELIATNFIDLNLEIAKRLFIASYCARGMNYRDLAKLKSSQISQDNERSVISYKRNKTSAEIVFTISPLLKKQIDWFKNNCSLFEDYLFPIYNCRPDDDYNYLKMKLNEFNYRLKKIQKKLKSTNENFRLSSYTARHSFATQLYQNNIDISIISQCLSHQSITTTKRYLKKFEEKTIAKEIEHIIG